MLFSQFNRYTDIIQGTCKPGITPFPVEQIGQPFELQTFSNMLGITASKNEHLSCLLGHKNKSLVKKSCRLPLVISFKGLAAMLIYWCQYVLTWNKCSATDFFTSDQGLAGARSEHMLAKTIGKPLVPTQPNLRQSRHSPTSQLHIQGLVMLKTRGHIRSMI